MANVLGTLFGEIATAIREKTGDHATMKPAEFPDKISGIDVSAVLQDKTITENGTYTADSGYDGLGSVIVDVLNSAGGESAVALYTGTFTTTGTWNETVSIDFGFSPDFLFIYFTGTYTNTTSSKNVMMYEFSQKAKETFGKAPCDYAASKTLNFYANNYSQNGGYYLESTDTNCPINNTSATGFTFGKTHPAGTFRAIALKLF